MPSQLDTVEVFHGNEHLATAWSVDTVEVFHGNEHLATAWSVDTMENAQARRLLEHRAEEARWLARQHRAAARKRRQRFAPITEPRPSPRKRADDPGPARLLTPSRSLITYTDIPAHMVRPAALDKKTPVRDTSPQTQR